MELCLVRHGIAVERGSAGYEDDGLRPLTERGRKRMREAAAGLATLFVPDVILSSPLVRAWQTAEIVQGAYPVGPPIEACGPLATGDRSGLLAAIVARAEGAVMVVGHEPHLSDTLDWLVAGGAPAGGFGKGGAALVAFAGEAAAGAGALAWYRAPRELRRLGRR